MQSMYPFYSISRLRMLTDGEGVTTLVAGAGCPLHCRYCLNGKILKKEPTLITAPELYDRVKIDDLYFQATGGGVTFGGGESLLHVDFIGEFRKLIGDRWKIYAETSLFVSEETVRKAARWMDGFIVDIKGGTADISRNYTGADCHDRIFSNLALLKDLVGEERIRVRVPLIPGYNTREDQEITAWKLHNLGFHDIDAFEYVIR